MTLFFIVHGWIPSGQISYALGIEQPLSPHLPHMITKTLKLWTSFLLNITRWTFFFHSFFYTLNTPILFNYTKLSRITCQPLRRFSTAFLTRDYSHNCFHFSPKKIFLSHNHTLPLMRHVLNSSFLLLIPWTFFSNTVVVPRKVLHIFSFLIIILAVPFNQIIKLKVDYW